MCVCGWRVAWHGIWHGKTFPSPNSQASLSLHKPRIPQKLHLAHYLCSLSSSSSSPSSCYSCAFSLRLPLAAAINHKTFRLACPAVPHRVRKLRIIAIPARLVPKRSTALLANRPNKARPLPHSTSITCASPTSSVSIAQTAWSANTLFHNPLIKSLAPLLLPGALGAITTTTSTSIATTDHSRSPWSLLGRQLNPSASTSLILRNAVRSKYQ